MTNLLDEAKKYCSDFNEAKTNNEGDVLPEEYIFNAVGLIELMDAARKDEFFKTLDFISGLGLVEDGGVWIQAAGNGTAWTENQLYELFKKEK